MLKPVKLFEKKLIQKMSETAEEEEDTKAF